MEFVSETAVYELTAGVEYEEAGSDSAAESRGDNSVLCHSGQAYGEIFSADIDGGVRENAE